VRQKIKRTTEKFLAFLLSALLIFSLYSDNVLAYISDFNSTTIFYNEEREIAKGVFLNDWQGVNPDGTLKNGRTITFNPRTSDAMVLAAYGNSVPSRLTLSSLSYLTEQQGVSVIGGINGDFYHLNNGIPVGILIQDGRLISHSTTEWNAIGFKEDGSVVIGSPQIEMKAIINETEYPFVNFNKAQGDWGPYLYSEDFGPNTGSTEPSIEVILDINFGEPSMGKVMVATVKEIRKDTKSTPIGKNQLVMSAKNGKVGHYALSQFKVGDIVSFQFNDKTGQWSDVKQAIGGDKILINNGVITSGLPTKNYDPSTAIGVKADGDVVLFQVDGRSSASQGVSSYEIAQFLHKLGCVKAIQLDGGGSSAMIARKPGYKSPGLINVPSDGKERANTNGILLISKQSVAIKNGTAQPGTTASKLHIYPGTVYALPKAVVQYSALATDDYFFPVAVPQELTWISDAGTFDEKGNLTVNAAPGSYQVKVYGDYAIGSAELKVVNTITSIKPSKSSFSIAPGTSIDLSCEAYYRTIKVAATDEAFTWEVQGGIGSITPQGVFTAPPGASGNGKIIVKYGDLSASIDVQITSSPDIVEDFENGSKWGSSSDRAKSVAASIVTNQELAKSGSNVLKVDYDFTLAEGVQKGVAGAYAFKVNPTTGAKTGITLDSSTVAIGMWVYGDNSKTWLRATLKDSKGETFNIDFTPEYRVDTQKGGIDWTGWKYVEASIPSDKKGPFTLETPIRIMCSRDDMRTKGTLYFDMIRAVTSASKKDTQPPVLNVTSPADKATLNTNKFELSAALSDPSGIEAKSISVLLDGAQVPFTTGTSNGTVTIKASLGSDLPLADGLHRLTFNYADLFGNAGTKTITFTVETGQPQIIASSNPTVKEGGTFKTTLSVKNPKTLKKVYLDLRYDPEKVELVDSDPNTAGKQVLLDAWVKKGKIITHLVDEAKGRIVLEIDNLANLATGVEIRFGEITFKAKSTLTDSTKVYLNLGAMIVGTNPKSQRFGLYDMETKLEQDLILKVTGTKEGELTTITVTDAAGNPVSGAGIHLNDSSIPFWLTDEKGQVTSGILTKLAPGTKITLRAIMNEKQSNKVTIEIGK